MEANSKTRYGLLDALRGVAAIGVMLGHFGATVGATPIVPHGYLAVDFFFILSGFVVSHAYADRIDNLGFWSFCALRVKRLLPMSICGVLLGTIVLLIRWRFQPGLSDDLPHLLAASGLNIFLIPKLWAGRASGHAMFPANLVLWSLLLELAVNLFWAACFVHRRNRTLFTTSILGGIVFAASAWHHGDSSVGWNWSTLAGGIGRITFGFFAGVLLWRFRSPTRRSPFVGLFSGIALMLILCHPTCPWWAEVMMVLFVFPSLVYFAAGTASGDEPLASRLLGDISYPLYAIHWPLVMAVPAFLGWQHSTGQFGLSTCLLCFPIVALAYLTGRFYDVPVRRWLAKPRQKAECDPQMYSSQRVKGAI